MKPDWVTLSKSSGTGNETIQITAAPNTGRERRTGTIEVTTKSGMSKTLQIEQKAYLGHFKISKNSYITFEKVDVNLTSAIANCNIIYNGKSYTAFKDYDLLKDSHDLPDDIIIELEEGANDISFNIRLSMAGPTGPYQTASVNFEVFANGNEIMDPLSPWKNSSAIDTTFGNYPVAKDDVIPIEFYLNVYEISPEN
jgi:hypothetical protein